MPHSRTSAAEYLRKAIELSGKSQREIALAVGYAKPNVLSMMKLGQTKIPIEKVPGLARACGVDPSAFMRLVMKEYMPETWEAMRDTFGEALTTSERHLVEAYREIAPNSEIEVDRVVAFRVQETLRGADKGTAAA